MCEITKSNEDTRATYAHKLEQIRQQVESRQQVEFKQTLVSYNNLEKLAQQVESQGDHIEGHDRQWMALHGSSASKANALLSGRHGE